MMVLMLAYMLKIELLANPSFKRDTLKRAPYVRRSTAALRAPVERADKRVFIAHASAWQNSAMNHTALRAACLSARYVAKEAL
jgi:hypothetical protein